MKMNMTTKKFKVILTGEQVNEIIMALEADYNDDYPKSDEFNRRISRLIDKFSNLNDDDEVEKLESDAKKWRNHVSKMSSNLNNNLTAEEKSERARKAVQARWAKQKALKQN